MATIKLELPDSTPLAELSALANSLGCYLQLGRDGTYRAVPRYPNKVVTLHRQPALRAVKGSGSAA